MSNTNYLITRVFKDIYNYESIPDNAECKKKYTKLYNEINSKKEDEPETLEDLESAFSFPRMALRDFRERKARFLEKSLEDFSSNKNEIEELKLVLKKYQNHFILIFVHHPPVRINSKWLDEHCITNSDQLEEILSGYSNVRGIFTGHVHQERTTNWNNLLVYSSPSTCYQFVSDIQHFQLSTDAPGYRWINLHSDGFLSPP